MKICPSCFTENDEQSGFCQNCGQSLAEVAATQPPAEAASETPANEASSFEFSANESSTSYQPAGPKSIPDVALGYLKKYSRHIAAGIAALLVLIVLINLLSPAAYNMAKHSATSLSVEGETWLLFDGKEPFKVEGDIFARSNNERTAFAYTTEDNVLYTIERGDKTAVKVADDVSDFALMGSIVLYEVAADNKDGEYDSVFDLYTCAVGKSKGTLVAADVNDYTASTNGKVIVYKVDDDCFIYDGKSTKYDLGKGISPAYVSNNGKYFYYVKSTERENEDGYPEISTSLHVAKNGKDAEKLGDANAEMVGINEDGDEMLYNKDGSTYLSIDGKPGEKIISKPSSYLAQPSFTLGQPGSLIGQLVLCDGGLYKIGKTQDKTVKLVSNITSIDVAKDGKSVGYIKSDKIYRLTDMKAGNDAVALNADYKAITDYAFSPNLDKLYFVDSGDLYYVSGAKEPQRISADVDDIRYSFEDSILFAVKDDELYYTKNGGDLKKVPDIKGDVGNITVKATHIILETSDAYYRCTGGTSFDLIANK